LPLFFIVYTEIFPGCWAETILARILPGRDDNAAKEPDSTTLPAFRTNT
jgi:hypothetical protein